MNNVWVQFHLAHHGVKGMKWGIRKDRSGVLRTRKKNGNIDLQYFAYKPQKPFKFRNAKEKAIVLSNVKPNNLKRDQLHERLINMEINIDDQGAYNYTFVNRDGEGDFWPISRKRIKKSATKLYRRINDDN